MLEALAVTPTITPACRSATISSGRMLREKTRKLKNRAEKAQSQYPSVFCALPMLGEQAGAFGIFGRPELCGGLAISGVVHIARQMFHVTPLDIGQTICR